jgi:hypothetical protein
MLAEQPAATEADSAEEFQQSLDSMRREVLSNG